MVLEAASSVGADEYGVEEESEDGDGKERNWCPVAGRPAAVRISFTLSLFQSRKASCRSFTVGSF